MNSKHLSEKKVKFIIIALVVSSLLTSLIAITRNTELQKKQLSYTDSLLDAAIIEQNLRLQSSLDLTTMTVKRLMNNTKFIKTNDYIELQQYSVLNKSLEKDNITDTKDKSMRLYYKKDQLIKIETRLIKQDMRRREASISIIIDSSPLSKENDDIEIQQVLLKHLIKPISTKNISFKNLSTYKNTKIYKKTLGQLPNSTSNPFRINFKKDFYIPMLREFEDKFRTLIGLQLPTKVNKHRTIINTLESSTNY